MGTEECSSSESGWTMYIASPVEEDDAECSSYGDDNDAKNKKHVTYQTYAANEEDFGSDDSMASDASSGPSYQQYYQGRSHCKESHGKKDKKKSANKNTNKKEKKSSGEKNTKRK